MSDSIPQYNSTPFSVDDALCFLPASRSDLEGSFSPQELSLPSFFDHPAFKNTAAYIPPSDFLTRPRRVSGEIPDSVYPQALTAWFYSSDCGHPFVYEEARDLYFCIRIPFSFLSRTFAGTRAVAESNRKQRLLSLVSQFDRHLVRCFIFFYFLYSILYISVSSIIYPFTGLTRLIHRRSRFTCSHLSSSKSSSICLRLNTS